MEYFYVSVQLAILIGILVIGFYVVIKEDFLKPHSNEIESPAPVTDMVQAESYLNITIMDKKMG